MSITSIQETPLNQTQTESVLFALEALEGLINRTSAQAIYSFMETERRIAIAACVGLREALAEQPAQQQEPVAERFEKMHANGDVWITTIAAAAIARNLSSQSAQRKPEFKEFIKWAGAQGYDCGQTCNSDTGEWIALNPMTADLWKAWQAAHGIKEQP